MDYTQDPQLAELVDRSVLLAKPSLVTTKLDISYVGQNFVQISFDTIPGNNPSDNGNYVAIWQTNSNNIPWNSPALKTQKITSDQSFGDTIFTGLNLTGYSYIVGYGVGPELTGNGQQQYGNICSTAFIPRLDQPLQDPFSPSLTVREPLGFNSLTFSFRLPNNIKPLSNGGWIGLWEGTEISYDSQPDASNSIDLDKGTGDAVLLGLTLGRGATYTVGLYTSGWAGNGKPLALGAAACALTFTMPG